MKAGDLDRLITLQHRGEQTGTDAFNAPLYGAPVSLTVYAAFMPVSDRERMASAEVQAEITARFRTHWTPSLATLSPTWWLTFEGRAYDILGVKEIGRREGLEITACARAE